MRRLARLTSIAVVACIRSSAAGAQSPASDASPGLTLGAAIDLVPITHMKGIDGVSAGKYNIASIDGQATNGVEASFDVRVLSALTLGLSPRFVLVQQIATPFEGNEVDLRVRATLGGEITPGLRLHAIAQLGVSYVDNVFHGQGLDIPAMGPEVGIGVGIVHALTSRILFTAEIDWQWGRQRLLIANTVNQARVDIDQLTIANGLTFRLD
jgi:hypothetical protein